MDRKTKQWNDSYRLICNTVKDTGSLPSKYYDYLGYVWIEQQRKNKHGLTRKQRQQLEELPGFTWVESPEDYMAWYIKYYAVRTKLETQGFLHHEIDRSHYQWLARQKRNRHALTKDQQRHLEALSGFTWEVRKARTWFDSFYAVKTIVDTTGKGPDWKEDATLYAWWSNQYRRLDRLTEEQRQHLGALPRLAWGARTVNTWEENYHKMWCILEETHKPLCHKEHPALYGWFSNQCSRKDRLCLEKRQLLADLIKFNKSLQEKEKNNRRKRTTAKQ